MSSFPIMSRKARWALLFAVLILPASLSSAEPFLERSTKPDSLKTLLTLNETLSLVRENNLSLVSFDLDAQADHAEANSNNYFPDPTLFVSAQNLPTDTFEFDQEPMTQLRFGIRQAIPPGDTLQIKYDTLQMKSEMKYTMKDRRWLRLKRDVEQAWFEAWYWQKTLEILEEDAAFLQQTLDITQSLYEVGVRNQSEVLGVELEIIQLEEIRIDALKKSTEFKNKLNVFAQKSITSGEFSLDFNPIIYPNISKKSLSAQLEIHPDIMHKAHSVHIATQNIKLAEQSYSPRWSLEASYGLRSGENENKSDRPDFFSAGLSVQVPFFSAHSQDSKVLSASKRRMSAENSKYDALKNMIFEYIDVQQSYLISLDQSKLYQKKILPKLTQQKASILVAYQSAQMDFNRTVRVYLREQKARLKYNRIIVDQQKMLSKLIYWTPNQTYSASNTTQQKIEALQ